MGLTIFAFLAPPVLLALWSRARTRIRDTAWSRYFLAITLCFSAFTLSLGIAYLAAQPYTESQSVPLFFTRLAAAAAAAGYIVLFRVCMNFPYESRNRAADLAAAAAVLGILALNLGTPLYVIHVERVNLDFLRQEGPLYGAVTMGAAGLGFLGAVILLLRSLAMRSRIFQQQSLILALGIASSIVLGYLTAIRLPQVSRIGALYMVSTLSPLVLGTGFYYAVSITRIFAWKEVGRRLVSYMVLTVLAGAPVGAAVSVFLMIRGYPLVSFLGALFCFILGARLAGAFVNRYLDSIAGRRRYREDLQSELAHVDLAGGRDAVLKEVHGILSGPLGFSDFTVLAADDDGELRAVYSTSGAGLVLQGDSPALADLTERGITVLLKTDVIANRSYASVKKDLLEIYDSLRAEALIVVREGRQTLGIFALGARLSGGDYTTYDYETFRAVYGKLFVVLYYVKNIARESILSTVDREIAFSSQVIESIQENVDRIAHPKADAHFVARSTRKLGGDFIDFVSFGKDRYFFVVGDVSGKGLNASMSMLILKTMVRNFLKEEKDFLRIAERSNAFIKENLPKGTFFAGVFGYFDFEKDTLFFINCGIPVMYMYSPAFNTVIEIQGDGRVLGFVRDIRPYLKLRRVPLVKDSVLVISTDGILESESLRGERYGKERLQRSFGARRQAPAKELVEGLLGDLLAYTDNRMEDDITVFAMKYDTKARSEG